MCEPNAFTVPPPAVKNVGQEGQVSHVATVRLRIAAVHHLQQGNEHCQAKAIHQANENIQKQADKKPVPEMGIEVIKVLEVLFKKVLECFQLSLQRTV
jgi:hypothetical protein